MVKASYYYPIPDISLQLNTPTYFTPVILVPGIVGSSSGGEDNPIPKLSGIDAPDKNLHIHDPFHIVIYGIELSGGLTGFTNLREYLAPSFYVFDCPWDWRLTIDEAYKEYLIPVINDALKRSVTGKVHIVAHSMGGLVSRRDLQIFGDKDVEKLIIKTNKKIWFIIFIETCFNQLICYCFSHILPLFKVKWNLPERS